MNQENEKFWKNEKLQLAVGCVGAIAKAVVIATAVTAATAVAVVITAVLIGYVQEKIDPEGWAKQLEEEAAREEVSTEK